MKFRDNLLFQIQPQQRMNQTIIGSVISMLSQSRGDSQLLTEYNPPQKHCLTMFCVHIHRKPPFIQKITYPTVREGDLHSCGKPELPLPLDNQNQDVSPIDKSVEF